MTANSHQIPDLDRKGLREFAFVTGGVIAGLFGLVLPWLLSLAWPTWPWILSGVLVAVGLIAPIALQPVYKVWMRFGLILNRITTPVIMGLVFFLVIAPTGLVRRLFAEDPMKRKFSDKESYRIPSKKASAKNMERPF
jgi:Kef-type K+ transport system membrane component KefB